MKLLAFGVHFSRPGELKWIIAKAFNLLVSPESIKRII